MGKFTTKYTCGSLYTGTSFPQKTKLSTCLSGKRSKPYKSIYELLIDRTENPFHKRIKGVFSIHPFLDQLVDFDRAIHVGDQFADYVQFLVFQGWHFGK